MDSSHTSVGISSLSVTTFVQSNEGFVTTFQDHGGEDPLEPPSDILRESQGSHHVCQVLRRTVGHSFLRTLPDHRDRILIELIFRPHTDPSFVFEHPTKCNARVIVHECLQQEVQLILLICNVDQGQSLELDQNRSDLNVIFNVMKQ